MFVLLLLLSALQANGAAEEVRNSITAKCGIAPERLVIIDPTPELPMPGVMIKGSASLSKKQLRCFGDQLAGATEVYPMFEDDHLGARYSRLVEVDTRRIAQAAMRRRGLLARLP